MPDSFFKKASYFFRDQSREANADKITSYKIPLDSDEYSAFKILLYAGLIGFHRRERNVQFPDIDAHKSGKDDFMLECGEYIVNGAYDRKQHILNFSTNKPLPCYQLKRQTELVNAMILDNINDVTVELDGKIAHRKAIACADIAVLECYLPLLDELCYLHAQDPSTIATMRENVPPLILIPENVFQTLRAKELLPGNSMRKFT